MIGLEHLPTPIVEHMRQSLPARPHLDGVYHVTEIIFCLRKAYYRRMMQKNGQTRNLDLSGLWNIYRGVTFDNLWSRLFKRNQMTYVSKRDGLALSGTLDFVWVDEESLEKVLYDLKMPKNIYYKKKSGAGKFYIEQVQSYLAMAHEKGDLMDVHKARVMMLADDLVIEEVPERDDILDWLWERIKLLHTALTTKNPSILTGPEMKWECNEKYCEADINFRIDCKKEEDSP